MEGNAIDHFLHEHPLTLIEEQVNREFVCGGCDKSLSPGECPIYGCGDCEFYLDKACIINNIPRQINNHSFHPSCPLILLTTPSRYNCRGCDDEHVSGLVFRCENPWCFQFELDVKCALLPTLDQSKDADKIQCAGHQHPLVALRHNNKADSNINIIPSDEVGYCRACGERCSLDSNSFGCERCEFQFFIHRQCAVELKPVIHHYFHPLHPLTLTFLQWFHATSQCGACMGSIDKSRPMYRCAKCKFDLHFDCAYKPKPLLVKYEGHSHSHPLTFFDKIGIGASCNICKKEARNCIFRCVACRFDIHLHCHPSAPKTITHKSHLHPLTLTQSPFDFEFVSPEYEEYSDKNRDAYDFYCDVCEEKRFKPESVYYCTECKFIAEPRCVLSELLPSFSGLEDHPTGDDRASSRDDDNSAALEAYLAEFKEKKRPLKSEIKKLKATLKALEATLESLKDAKKDFLMNSLLSNYNK